VSATPALAAPAAALAALVAAGCGATESARTNPDYQLEVLMDRYAEVEAETGHAEHADEHPGELLDRGRLRRDIETLAIEFPGHVEILMACALVSYDAGEPERAQAYLDRLLRRQEVHPDAAVLRSRIALEEGNAPLAERLLVEHLRQVPDHPALCESLAGLRFQQERLGEAGDLLVRAEALGAPGWRVAYGLGLIAEATGDLEAAKEHYQEVIAAEEAHRPARSRLRNLQVVTTGRTELERATPRPGGDDLPPGDDEAPEGPEEEEDSE